MVIWLYGLRFKLFGFIGRKANVYRSKANYYLVKANVYRLMFNSLWLMGYDLSLLIKYKLTLSVEFAISFVYIATRFIC